MELRGEGSSSGKAALDETCLKLNGLMDMSPQSKNLFKIQTFNVTNKKILFEKYLLLIVPHRNIVKNPELCSERVKE